MHIAERRCYRLSLATGIALALGYGSGLVIPFIAPLLAVLLGAKPARPPGLRATMVIVIFLLFSLGIGVAIGPLLQLAPVSALLLIGLGLFFSSRLAIIGGKDVPATLLAMGFTVIPAASCVSQVLAMAIIAALVISVVIAIISLWLAYALFPELPGYVPQPPASPGLRQGDWLALRATLVVLPAFMFTLTNPVAYLPLTVKSILLGREASAVNLRSAGREMVGSTALGGACAIAIWSLLSLAVELWFFAGWVTLATMLLTAEAFGARHSRMTPGFWINTLTTTIILLGAAVQDSANGKDVYQAFAVRLALFILVTLYATLVVAVLELWRESRNRKPTEIETC